MAAVFSKRHSTHFSHLNLDSQTTSNGCGHIRITEPLELRAGHRVPSYYLHTGRRIVSLTDALDTRIERIMGFAEVDDQHLILASVYKACQLAPQCRQLLRVELAKKHAVLSMISTIVQCLKDMVPTLVVGDIIGDEIVPSGHG